MGLIKGMLFMSGMPVRPSTTRERSRHYQKKANRLQAEANDLLAEQVESLRAMRERPVSIARDPSPMNSQQSASSTQGNDQLERLNQLERLHNLHLSGALSDEEFNVLKNQLLDGRG